MLWQMVRFNPFYGWVVSIVYVYPIFFIHSSADGHLGCLHILATVNNAAMKNRMHISFWISIFVSFKYIPRSGIAGSYIVLLLVFWEPSILFSTVATLTVYEDSFSPTSSPMFVIRRFFFFFFFDDRPSDRYEMISQCEFDLHFPDD